MTLARLRRVSGICGGEPCSRGAIKITPDRLAGEDGRNTDHSFCREAAP